MRVLIIAQLTIQETQRRRILWIALVLAIAFVAFFAVAFHYIYQDVEQSGLDSENGQFVVGTLLAAGLYAINFLVIVTTVVTSVTAVSEEIESHTIEALLTKPLRRWELILGKWVGFAVMLLVYVVILSGGIILFVNWRTGYTIQNVLPGFSLMVLQGLLVLSLTMAGGTRLSSLANGVLAFMLYGLAFLGGWVEQIGAMLRNETAVDIGIVTSLIMPTEILWKRALTLFQPQFANLPMLAGPFAVMSQPSDLMMGYAVFYMLALLGLAMWSFSRRDL